MNDLEERMLTLLAYKIRTRPEIAADLELVTAQIKASRQTQEDWIRLAEKASLPAEAAPSQRAGA
jgi:hypothetical protein